MSLTYRDSLGLRLDLGLRLEQSMVVGARVLDLQCMVGCGWEGFWTWTFGLDNIRFIPCPQYHGGSNVVE